MISPFEETSHFPLVPLGRLVTTQLGKMLQPEAASVTDLQVPYLRAGLLSDLEMLDDLPTMYASAKDRQTYEVREGDLIVAEGGDVGRSEFVPKSLDGTILQNSLHRLRPRSGDLRFVRYSLEAVRGSGWLDVLCNRATFGHLTAEKLSALLVPSAGPDAQRAIADYLDAETARIDALIEKKQRMVELMDERDFALAHDAITGGPLGGNRVVSPVPWLRDLPKGWRLAPVGSQFQVALGRMLNAERAASGEMRRYVRNVNVRWDTVNTNDLAVMDFPTAERRQYRLQAGDLLINEGGAGIGRAAIWQDQIGECYFQKSVLRLRPIAHSHPAWMIECMRVAVSQRVLLVEGNLATIPHVPAEALRVYRFPFPPRDVQSQMLAWLQAQRGRDLPLRTAIEQQIDLLTERRQALITAAVTGELDIPGVAA